MAQKIIDLYDASTHGGISRRSFFDRLATLAGSAAAASVLLAALRNDYALAQTVPEEDDRIATETVAVPGAMPCTHPVDCTCSTDGSLDVSCMKRKPRLVDPSSRSTCALSLADSPTRIGETGASAYRSMCTSTTSTVHVEAKSGALRISTSREMWPSFMARTACGMRCVDVTV